MHKKNTLLTALLLAAGALTASADSFTMKVAGTDFCICVDAGISVTLTWGDGATETFVSDGTPHSTAAKTEDVSVTTDTYVRNLYLAGNKATTFDVGSLSRLEVLDLCDNDLTTLSLTKLTALESLLINGNHISNLSLAKQGKLRKLHASGNDLDALALNTADITDFWVDGCMLKGTLDLAKQNHLRSLNASSNMNGHLDHVLLANTTAAKNALEYVNLSNNYLFFDSFPTVYDKVAQKYTVISRLDGQKPFHYVDYFLPDQQYDISDLIRYNAWSTAIGPKVELYRMTKPGDYTPVAENLLVEGTDFTKVGSYKYTFVTHQSRVFFRVTSDFYPDLVLVTEPFGITDDPEGINSVLTDGDAAPAYDLQGRPIVREVQAPAGLRIQNGKKVITK